MRKLIAAIAALPATMSGMARVARRLDGIRRKQPHIEISQSGWRTDRPEVHVSMVSRGGMIGVYSYADDDAGNAHVSMNASSLANITGLRIVDRRPMATNEARGSLLSRDGAVWLPRDGVAPLSAKARASERKSHRNRRLARA